MHHKKKILLTIENGNMLNLDLNDDINRISSLLNIDKKTIIIYPDKTRQMLLDMYYYKNIEKEKIIQISEIFQDFCQQKKTERNH